MPNFNLPDILDREKERQAHKPLSSPDSAYEEGLLQEDTQQGLQSSIEAPQLPEGGEEGERPKPGLVDYGTDIAMMAPRALEGFAESVWGLADWISGDRLWDWDRKRDNLFGRSKTVPGMLGEGILQFATGFIPGVGVAGWAGKVSKAGKLVGKSGDLLSKGVLQHAYRGNKTLKLSTMRKIRKAKPKVRKYAQFVAAGAMADFVAFKGEEARLSNLLIGHKGEESSAILEYLAYDPGKDNNEIEERFKNVIEGFVVGNILTGAFFGARGGVRKIKAAKEKRVLNIGQKHAAKALEKTLRIFRDKGKIIEEQKLSGAEPDEVIAARMAVERNRLTPQESKSLSAFESEAKDAHMATEYEAVTKRKISEEKRPEAVTRAQKGETLFSEQAAMRTKSELDEFHFGDTEGGALRAEEDRIASLSVEKVTKEKERVLSLPNTIKPKNWEEGTGQAWAGAGSADKVVSPFFKSKEDVIVAIKGQGKDPADYNIKRVDAQKALGDDSITGVPKEWTATKKGDKVPVKPKSDEAPEGKPALEEAVGAPLRRKDGTPFKTEAGAKSALTRQGLNPEEHRIQEAEGGGWEVVSFKAADEEPARFVVPEPEAPKYSDINVAKATEEQLDDWITENLGTSMRALPEHLKRTHVKEVIEKADAEEHVLKRMDAHAEQKIRDLGLFDETNPQAAFSAINSVRSMPELRAMVGRLVRMGTKASMKEGGRKALVDSAKKAEFYNETSELIGEGLALVGGKKTRVTHNMESFRGRANDLVTLRTEAEALYKVLGTVTDDVGVKVANATEAQEKGLVVVKLDGVETTLSAEQSLTEMFSSVDRFLAVQELWADFGTQLSLGLRQRHDLYVKGYSSLGRDIAGQNRSLGFDVLIDSPAAQRLYRKGTRPAMKDSKFLKQLQMATKTNVTSSTKAKGDAIKGAVDMATANNLAVILPVGKKALAVTQEWYINALLGSPTTWMVNLIGNGLVMSLRHFEMTAGAAITGNKNLLRANFRTLFDMHGFIDSLRYAAKAGWDDEAKSVMGHTAYSDNRIRARGEIGFQQNPNNNIFKNAINWVGKGVRHPTRILMAGDEFFKQMHFRAHTRTLLAMEGYEKGLHKTPGALADFVEEGYKGLITTQGRFRNQANVLKEAHDLLATKSKGKDAVVNREEFIAKHMDRHFNNHAIEIEDGVMYSAKDKGQRDELVQAGTDWALINTFTNNPTNRVVKALSDFATFSPWLTFVIPFVRTPANIITFALGRTAPIGTAFKMPGIAKRTLDKATGKDVSIHTPAQVKQAMREYGGMPHADQMIKEKMELINRIGSVEAADYTGRMSTAVLAAGSFMLLAEGMKDRITGAAPKSRTKRAAWEATGKQPYSIKLDLGDGEKWHSYQRMDPFATIIGIWTDLVHGFTDTRDTGESEFGTAEELEEKQSEINRVFGVVAMSFANNVSNKSYVESLANLFDLLRKPSQTFDRTVGGIIGGFVPNGLNAAQNIFQEEPAILEARGLLDHLMKKLPEPIRPKKLMPKRNFLGEIKRKQNLGGPQAVLNPIFRSDVSDDIVDMEIEQHGVGKGLVSPVLSVGGQRINMRDFANADGQTAYDRLQELSGTIELGSRDQTMRQALRELIESDDYQRLPQVTEQNASAAHPRTKLISTIINYYRSRAKHQVFKEYKALRNKYAALLQ